jgi:osmotically-inducible protein OsmY
VFDDVNVGVKDGRVTLEGRVTAENMSEEFADEAARVFGVQEVDNRIEVLPASNFDSQLRWTIAREIYSDIAFVGLASSHAAPIHVIVEHGHVTLTGVVSSEVEKRKAEFIARGTFGALGVTNRIRVE